MSSGEPGRVVVTAATAFESRAGAEGAQQERGIRRPFTVRGRRSSSEFGDSTHSAFFHPIQMMWPMARPPTIEFS